MDTESEQSAPLRQWRVTITEDGAYRQRSVLLSWRTFPCTAAHWDGHATFTFPSTPDLPITSQEALRDLLGDLAAAPWVDGLRQRR